MKESAATKRARERNYEQDNTWYCELNTSIAKGLEQEENIHRRDPSSVILVDGLYYTYYSRSVGDHVGFHTGDLEAKVFPWDLADIWYATSKDGYVWEEKGVAVARGERGSYDDRSVFTPEVLKYEGKYYLVYQVEQHPYVNRCVENIAIAYADSPTGPFIKSPSPIVYAEQDGEWEGEEDNRFAIKSKGSFDSHKVHDPLLFHYKDKFYLYYKGEPMGEEVFMGGRETKWGLAIADNILGPYVKSEWNPITNSGHETCLWKYKDGMAALLRTDGFEKNTLQYAEDGINFEIKAGIPTGTSGLGPFRPDDPENSEDPLDGIRWGLTHIIFEGWNFIVRFDADTSKRDNYKSPIV